MKVTLTVRSAQETAAEYGSTGQRQEVTLTLEGTPAEIQAGITELFDADRANDLRRELGFAKTCSTAEAVKANKEGCGVIRF
ncbi:hypothetical protein [Deinococcus wulumuqiensis]|uniref:hypothetical protein n=1 Tax=Deinococcus wulumuqiensis TaxID=980427 RepID=UPI00242DBF3B|nr:hypothetical protein [Deinococcus wulumuqiensis]